jgi:cytochrome c peroxidase
MRKLDRLFKYLASLILMLFISGFYFSGSIKSGHKNFLAIDDSAACEELGERLFSDVRFSSPDGRISGFKQDEYSQFRLSCKSCHLVDEKLKEKGMRGYTDFSKRTQIPFRKGDEKPTRFTNRRTQQLINIAGNNISSASSYHWDGEFDRGDSRASLLALINKTFSSVNMGWREGEEKKSSALRLKYIIEEDNYAAGNSGNENPSYIEQYCRAFGLTRGEFFQLSGEEILSLCNLSIAFYIENIKSDIESSFDIFLKENGISNPGSADEKILEELISRKQFVYLNKTIPVLNSEIAVSRKVRFMSKELRGLKLFLNREKTNCTSCHTPPSFTDNKFYNIGVSEFDYKDIHGSFPGNFYTKENLSNIFSKSSFEELRNKFQRYPEKNMNDVIDLGRALFADSLTGNIAAFRTPGLRNLKYSGPYLHSGRAASVKDAVLFHSSSGQFKNYLPFLSDRLRYVQLTELELDELVAFLNSLNDHYE